METFAAEAFIRARLIAHLPTGTPCEPAPYEEANPYPACVYKQLTSNNAPPSPDGYITKIDLDYLVIGMAVADNIADLVAIVKAIGQTFGNPGGQGISGVNAYGTVFAVRVLRTYSAPYLSNSKKVYQQTGLIIRLSVKGNYS